MVSSAPTLVGVPWDSQSSFLRGAAGAPPLIRQALFSPAANMWTEALVDVGAPGLVKELVGCVVGISR